MIGVKAVADRGELRGGCLHYEYAGRVSTQIVADGIFSRTFILIRDSLGLAVGLADLIHLLTCRAECQHSGDVPCVVGADQQLVTVRRDIQDRQNLLDGRRSVDEVIMMVNPDIIGGWRHVLFQLDSVDGAIWLARIFIKNVTVLAQVGIAPTKVFVGIADPQLIKQFPNSLHLKVMAA